MASTFLSDRLVPGEPIRTFVRRAPGFRLPPSPDTPIIMIGPGTGVAPFRAFLQERRAIGAAGRNWLVFGNPDRGRDFLFEEELLACCRDGLLTRLDTAFSRDQESKIYARHRLLERARELWSWVEEGAHRNAWRAMSRRGSPTSSARRGAWSPPQPRPISAWLAAEGRYHKDSY